MKILNIITKFSYKYHIMQANLEVETTLEEWCSETKLTL